MKVFTALKSGMTLLLLIITFISYSQVQITIKPGPEDGKDAYVNSYYELRVDTTSSFIAAAWTYGGTEGIGRSFIQFSLPELPKTYSNFKATLNFYYNYSSHHVGHGGDNACKLERIVEDWTETGVLWYDQPAVTAENAVILPASVEEDQDYPNIDVTQLVTDMYNNPRNSFGFRLSLVEESIMRSMIFASSDHIDESIRPSLVISYDTCDLPVGNYTYQTDNLFCQFNYEDSTVNSWMWDFGNGYGSTLQNPPYYFNEPGAYYVCLEVNNSCGSRTICDSIIVCDELIPQFIYTIDELNVNFSNLTTNGLEFFWDFGNGFFSYLENPEFQYERPGEYVVCLTVTNECTSATVCDTISGLKSYGIASYEGDNLYVEVYPNPASGEVSFQVKEMQIRKIEIYNNLGIFMESITPADSQDIYRLSLQGKEAGLYMIRVYTDHGVTTSKFIVQ